VASRLLVVATGRAAKLVNEQGNKLGSETTRHFLRTPLAVVGDAQFKLAVLPRKSDFNMALVESVL